MTWFTETAWPPIVAMSAGVLVLIALWQQRKQGIYLLGTTGLVLVCVATYFVEQRIVTPREEVEAAVLGITGAFQQGNPEATFAHISQQAPNLHILASVAIRAIRVSDDMRVSDFNTKLTSRDSRATSTFRLNATIAVKTDGGEFYDFQPTRWETTWQREKDAWKLIKIQELDPMTGEQLHRVNGLSHMLSGVGAN